MWLFSFLMECLFLLIFLSSLAWGLPNLLFDHGTYFDFLPIFAIEYAFSKFFTFCFWLIGFFMVFWLCHSFFFLFGRMMLRLLVIWSYFLIRLFSWSPLFPFGMALIYFDFSAQSICKVSLSPYSHWHLSLTWISAILSRCDLVARYVERFFIYFLATCVSSSEICQLRLPAHFLTGLDGFSCCFWIVWCILS